MSLQQTGIRVYGGKLRTPDHLASGVDARGEAVVAPQRTDAGHHTIHPDEAVTDHTGAVTTEVCPRGVRVGCIRTADQDTSGANFCGNGTGMIGSFTVRAPERSEICHHTVLPEEG